jgi:hypothetical protein
MLAAPRALGQRLGVNSDPGHVNSGAAGEGPSSPLLHGRRAAMGGGICLFGASVAQFRPQPHLLALCTRHRLTVPRGSRVPWLDGRWRGPGKVSRSKNNREARSIGDWVFPDVGD